MSIIAIIPSRYASTRFEAKALAVIAGKCMIQRVYEQAKKSQCVTDVVVATDSRSIADIVEGFGGKVVMTSDKNRSGTDRVAEAANILNLAPDDILINIQGDQPVFDPRCLDQLVEPFSLDSNLPKDLQKEQQDNLQMTTLAFKIVNKREITDPKDVKVTFDNNGFALYFSRSPIPYGRDESTIFDTYKHLGFYAYTKKFLDIFKALPQGNLEEIEKLEQLRVLEHGYKIKVVVTPYDSLEVDILRDIGRVEHFICAG